MLVSGASIGGRLGYLNRLTYIIDPDLWDAVKRRQLELDRKVPGDAATPFCRNSSRSICSRADALRHVREWVLQDQRRTGELRRVRTQIARLVDAVADGMPAATLRDKLASLEQRRLALESEIAEAVAPSPRLHPNLAEVYRQKVAELVEALKDEDGDDARELVRGLIEEITLYPEEDGLRVELR